VNLDKKNIIVKKHGLSGKDDPNYDKKKQDFLMNYINSEQGMIKPNQFKEFFNSSCRKYHVPFVMSSQDDECYVVHTTDIFTEKLIRELPKFLSTSDLKDANKLFIEAYRQRDMGKHKECLAKVREGMEAVRDHIYESYGLSRSKNLHNDMKKLFETHKGVVFDFNKIPESDKRNLEKMINYLEDSLLLAVKFANVGHHNLENPSLIEEKTSLFLLGLVSSLFPYLVYLLKV
jgi:hypothetical protein